MKQREKRVSGAIDQQPMGTGQHRQAAKPLQRSKHRRRAFCVHLCVWTTAHIGDKIKKSRGESKTVGLSHRMLQVLLSVTHTHTLSLSRML